MRIWAAGCLAAVVMLAAGAGAVAQTKDVEIPYQKFVLDNGLTLIVHEDRKAPIVAINIWYHVGSKNEKAGKTGFAHLFEHLMFGGSDHAKGSYIEALQRIGATDLNGTTNNDRTNYFENVPTSAVDFTLWMESDRMGFLTLDQKTLDLQRGVVQNEKRQGENQPYAVSYQLITQNTYPAGHPYSWTVIGDMADLNAAAMDDVKEWFKTYYGPSNVVIVMAGDIDAKAAKEKVEKYFGNIPAGPPVAHQQVWVAKMTGTHRQVVQDRVPQARIYKVWNIPEYGSADSVYLDLVSDILTNGKTSRFYKRLVYDDQIATDAGAFVDLNEIAGQFLVQATAPPGQGLAQVEKEADEELARFLKDGPTAEELQRVKTQYDANFVRRVERIGGFGGKSDRLAQSEVFRGSPDAYKTSLKLAREATAEDLKAAANRWLSDGVYILEVLPFPQYKTAAAAADRSKAPVIGTPPELKLPKLQRATLSNGLKVVLAERHEVPLVSFWMTSDAGYAADEFAAPGTANMTMALLTGGTKTRNALEISDQLAMLGAELHANSNLDMSTVELSALKSKLDLSLELFADVILNPSFPDADFKRQQKLRLAAIEREKNTPVQMALRVFPGLLYGAQHAYGNPLTGSGTSASVAKMTREDLAKFHETWFKPNNATLLVVGDTTLEGIKPKLEKLFATWKPGEVPQRMVPQVAEPEKTVVYLIDRPGSGQSVIFGAQLAPPRNDPDAVALQLVNDIFGGKFSSRINMNLREDKHWSYGVFSVLPAARGQRPYISISAVQTDKTKESMSELVKEYHNIGGGKPITEEEVKDEQNNATLGLPGTFETAQQLGTAYGTILQYSLPEDYFNSFTQKALALTPESANEIAKKYILPDQLVWVVVGDMSKVEAGIRELDLGEVHKIDADANPVK